MTYMQYDANTQGSTCPECGYSSHRVVNGECPLCAQKDAAKRTAESTQRAAEAASQAAKNHEEALWNQRNSISKQVQAERKAQSKAQKLIKKQQIKEYNSALGWTKYKIFSIGLSVFMVSALLVGSKTIENPLIQILALLAVPLITVKVLEQLYIKKYETKSIIEKIGSISYWCNGVIAISIAGLLYFY